MSTPGTAVANRAKLVPQLPADMREELAAESVNIKERIGAPAGDYIGVNRDKTFRLPGIEKEGEVLEVVVVDFIAVNQYYKGKYDPKNIQPPVCMAAGAKLKEMVPFENVPDKQHDNCDKCPQNQWGSDGKGKACKNQRVLAVVAPSDPTGSLMLLKVSPTGVKFWDGYVTKIVNSPLGDGMPSHPISMITRITFDGTSEYPSLRFESAGFNPALGETAARRKEARTRLLTPPDLSNAPTKK